MLRPMTLGLAAAAAAAIFALPVSSANAMPAGRHQTFAANQTLQVRHVVRRDIRERHRAYRHYRHGSGLYFSLGNNNDCTWLKRRALRTGSSYWWHRYNVCRWN